MGWFKKPKDYARRHMRFSSPSGDGVVLIKKRREHYDNQIFVPEWGWVGSRQALIKKCQNGDIFVPEWGWVGSTRIRIKRYRKLVFVPEWGWVGS